ncbi:nucleotidyltransferase family protein [Caminibacter pacificus]|jgi:predicted nucleotidyltransferase
MNKLQILKNAKKELAKEGFFILGVVGSFARGEKFNDIDIIYETDENFENKYLGWDYFVKIEEIKKYLEDVLNSKIDLINNSSMNNIAKKYMMKDFINV